MFVLAGCAFLTTAAGSLAGNIGADAYHDYIINKHEKEKDKEKDDGGK